MMSTKSLLPFLLLSGFAAAAAAAAPDSGEDAAATIKGELQVQIQSPTDGFVASDGQSVVEVDGAASTIGGVQYLDLMFVLDTSSSLKQTDPEDYRSLGAIGLVKNLSPKSNVKIGVVSFSGKGKLVQPLSSDRETVSEALRNLPRSGSTDVASGIRTALRELKANGRPGSSRMIMLFTDGKSDEQAAYDATVEAQMQGVVIHPLLLGSNSKGTSILDTIAWATGGSFVEVKDPTMLPEAFLNLRTTGVDSVTLSVNGSEPAAAKLAGGTFSGDVPLQTGENRIVALATSLDGRTQESVVNVTVRDASCAALQVAAVKDGRPVVSLDDRAVEIVVDASRSMWGRMYGEPKMAVAKETLEDVSYWFPQNLDLALRAYGSTSPSEKADCADSRLLVPFGEQNRDPIRSAIAGLRPLGQTPIAYSLREAASDFGALESDRALVLLTDGIESCGGDPIQAARELRQEGIVVHVIGFGLGNTADEDTASLRAVANASGGRYVTAGSAEELKAALAQTVATSFDVFKGNIKVASGALGSDESILLPEGDYRVEVQSSPPQDLPVRLDARDSVTLTLTRQAGAVSHVEYRDQMPYQSCDDVAASIERLEADPELQEDLQTAVH